ERRKLWERDLLTRNRLAVDSELPQSLLSLDSDGGLYLALPSNTQEKLGQIGPLAASHFCLRTRDGLTALDPVSGAVLWTKTNVGAQTQIFGDDEFIYLVELRDDRSVGGTRAIRGRDGASVEVPNFANTYQHRQRVLGGRLFVSETNLAGEI